MRKEKKTILKKKYRNPLRIGLSYTVYLKFSLYDEKSPVCLVIFVNFPDTLIIELLLKDTSEDKLKFF